MPGVLEIMVIPHNCTVDSQESLTGEDRPELSGTTKEVTKRNNADHILDRLINWQYLLPSIKLFYILP